MDGAEHALVAALSEDEGVYRDLVQQVNSVILRWSRDGSITFFNEHAERVFGWSAAEVLGRPVTMLVPEQDSLGVDLTGLERQILGHPEAYGTTLNENVRRDGSRIWMTWTNSVVLDEHGDVREVLAVGSDVTELRLAEVTLEEASRLSRSLNGVNELVHSTLDFDEIMQGALEQAVLTLHCTAGTIEIREAGGWKVGYESGLAPADVGTLLTPAQAPLATEAGRSRRVLALERPDHRLDAGLLGERGFGSALVVPLQARTQVIGCLLLLDAERRVFTAHETDFAEKLGVTVSLALQNALHYAARALAEREARDEAETSSTLLRAAEVLTSSTDVQTVLENLADLAQEALHVGRLSILGYDQRSDALRMLVTRGRGSLPVGGSLPVDTLSETVRQAVAAHSEAVVDFDLDGLPQQIAGRAAQYDSRLVHWVPIEWQDELLGFLCADEPGQRRRVSGRELELVQAVCDQAAAAIANARLFEEQRRIATTLQENLLHPLPTVEGLEIAVRSLPANQPELVGGDFSDVFLLDDGRVTLTIGDVAGKGVRAAGLTETARSTMRAFAAIDGDPGFVLRKTNDVFLRHDKDEPHVTALLCVLDVAGGQLAVASAGHPPPVHLSSSGATSLDLAFGPPLGTFPGEYECTRQRLDPHDYLVLYTDGVTEARHGRQLFGEARLVRAVRRLRGRSAEEVADGVLTAARQFSDRLRDDVQLMVVRLA